MQNIKAYVGKLLKSAGPPLVGALCKRDFRHPSRLKTAPTDVLHQIADMSQH